MTYPAKHTRGFTLIEVLIVIAIIGILSTMILANVSQAQNEARASRTVRHFQEIEKALRLWGNNENRDEWWSETELNNRFGIAAPPTISDLRSASDFSRHLPSTPTPPIGDAYYYDYEDGDELTVTCPSDPNEKGHGVNIVIRNANLQLFDEVNRMIDGDESSAPGDPGECGRLRAINTAGLNVIIYTMSRRASF